MSKGSSKTPEEVAEKVAEQPANLPAKQQGGKADPARAIIYGQDVVSEAVGGLDEALALMKQIEAANYENIGSDEIRVSRLAIAQPGTPEVAGTEDGWAAGMLFDSMLREPISIKGKAPWLLSKGIAEGEIKTSLFTPFLPIFKLPTEYVKWPTKDEKASGIKRFHWKLLDAHDPRVREGLWKPKGTWEGEGSPPVTETVNILGMCLDETGVPISSLIITSFSRTSFRTGGKFVSALNAHRLSNMPFWGRVYYFFTNGHTVEVQGQKTTYYSLDFAKGEKLLEFCAAKGTDGNALFLQALAVAKELSNKEHGKELQHRYLQMAEFADDGDATGGTGDETVMDAGTTDPEFA